MPRVHTQKARKDYPANGIKKGDIYYKWTIKTGPASGTLYRSATYPKPWELTHSPFEQGRLQIEDAISNLPEGTEADNELSDILSQIEQLQSECEESLEAIPESLREGHTGELLQERIDNCEAWHSELEEIQSRWVDLPAGEHEDYDELYDQHVEILEEAQSCMYPG